MQYMALLHYLEKHFKKHKRVTIVSLGAGPCIPTRLVGSDRAITPVCVDQAEKKEIEEAMQKVTKLHIPIALQLYAAHSLLGALALTRYAVEGRVSVSPKDVWEIYSYLQNYLLLHLFPQLHTVDFPKWVQWKRANLNEGIPLDPDSAHMVLAAYILKYLQDPDKFFREANKILKKGGVLIIHDPSLSKHSKEELEELFNHYGFHLDAHWPPESLIAAVKHGKPKKERINFHTICEESSMGELCFHVAQLPKERTRKKLLDRFRFFRVRRK